MIPSWKGFIAACLILILALLTLALRGEPF
jgi:hypothetical protein